MKMMKEDKDALCDSTWTGSRNYELVSVYLDLSGVWINLRYPLQWQRAHAIILMGLHVSTQFIPPAAPHLCLPLLTLGDSHFL